jgi:hypothetical protein
LFSKCHVLVMSMALSVTSSIKKIAGLMSLLLFS